MVREGERGKEADSKDSTRVEEHENAQWWCRWHMMFGDTCELKENSDEGSGGSTYWGCQVSWRESVPWWKDSFPGLNKQESLQHGPGSIWILWTMQYLLSTLTIRAGGQATWSWPSSKLPDPVYFPWHSQVQKRAWRKDFVCYSGSVGFLEQGSFYVVAQLWEHFSFDKRSNGEWSIYLLISLIHSASQFMSDSLVPYIATTTDGNKRFF